MVPWTHTQHLFDRRDIRYAMDVMVIDGNLQSLLSCDHRSSMRVSVMTILWSTEISIFKLAGFNILYMLVLMISSILLELFWACNWLFGFIWLRINSWLNINVFLVFFHYNGKVMFLTWKKCFHMYGLKHSHFSWTYFNKYFFL